MRSCFDGDETGAGSFLTPAPEASAGFDPKGKALQVGKEQ